MGEYYQVGVCKSDDSKKLFSLGFIAEAKLGDSRPIVSFAYPIKVYLVNERAGNYCFCFSSRT